MSHTTQATIDHERSEAERIAKLVRHNTERWAPPYRAPRRMSWVLQVRKTTRAS